jgi:hypothetical protein
MELKFHYFVHKIGPYYEPDESSPHPYTLLLSFILLLSSHLRLGFENSLLRSVFLYLSLRHDMSNLILLSVDEKEI